MNNAFFYPLPDSLGLPPQGQAQHAAPRRQPGSSAVTLRAGRIGIRRGNSIPNPSRSAGVARGSHHVPVSDQSSSQRVFEGPFCPKGTLGRMRGVPAGRLIADVSADVRCRTDQHDDNVPEMRGVPCNGKTTHAESFWGTGVALACDASDQGSGVDTDNRCPRPHLNCPTVLIAGGVGQHGGAPLVDASSHESESVKTFPERRHTWACGVPDRT